MENKPHEHRQVSYIWEGSLRIRGTTSRESGEGMLQAECKVAEELHTLSKSARAEHQCMSSDTCTAKQKCSRNKGD
jgi:hypothetical protein